jgi:CHAD domain-containing protein
MAGLRASAKRFARGYAQRTKDLQDLAGSPLEGLSPTAIHDLRVAARRVQMLCRLLPRESRRSKDYERFDAAVSSLLKATSRVRDLDTLTLTLKLRKDFFPRSLFSTLTKERDSTLRGAKAAIEAVSDAHPPILDSSRIDSKKLSKRLRKRVDTRSRVVLGLLGTVLRDESCIDELHVLRKETKKLRYLLELADESPRELPVLTAWQERLGAIRDFDVAIDYLRQSLSNLPLQKANAELMRRRHLGYRKFAMECRRDQARVLEASAFLSLQEAT